MNPPQDPPPGTDAGALLYVADPMCSWCWGFAPVVRQVSAESRLPVGVMVGGLRPGPAAQPLDDRLAGYLRDTWTHIGELTGQPFDFSSLDWEDWVYDTELPARSVVALRESAPDRTLEFFARVQRAFYAEGVDVTRPEAYDALVGEFGLEPGAFRQRLLSDDVRRAAWSDFDAARQLGISGFPALLYVREGKAWALTLGYRPLEQVREALREVPG